MLIDDKGKLFGKVSIVDIAVVLVLFALIGGIYYKFFMINKSGTAAQFDTLQYQVRPSSGVRQASVDAIQEGLDVFHGETGAHIGKIIKKEVAPAKGFIKKADGTFVEAEMPGKYDMILTVEVSGVEKSHGYFANGVYEIKRGSDLPFKTQVIELETKILDVTRVE